ncbi:MAG: hypothetical protein GY708_24185 [Actinomycetia bacterium]|nr:hypothetical protein [Actinomycetes bacterium]MCP4958243.1 hypothetical protein [Actinomycetes bacterium]
MNTREALSARLARSMPKVNDHPDIAGLFLDAGVLQMLGPALAAPLVELDVNVIIAPEARGFALGTLVAAELGVGLVLARKAGNNHPGADMTVTSGVTWRGTPVEFVLRSEDIESAGRFAVVDDWITTGHSARAMRDPVVQAGGEYVGCTAIVNKATPETIAELKAHTLVDFDDI